MATQTTVLDLTKPAGNENALISVINGNMDKVDAEAGKVRGNVAADYSTSSAYAVGALCIYGGTLYSCNTAIGTGGEAWNAAHWTQVTIAGELAGVAAEIPEVVDNLTTTSSTKALSAGQGKSLADQIANNGVFNSDSTWYAKSTDGNNVYQLQTKPDEIAALLSASGSWSRYWTLYPKEMGNTVSANLNTVTTGRMQIFITDENTLNSMYKQSGGASNELVISYASSNNYAVQLGIPSGFAGLHIRAKVNGTWTTWKTIQGT